MVKFSHSIFALPFALCSAWLAAQGTPPLLKLLGIVGAMVTARSAAMGFNRLIDQKFDEENPRTRSRELPAGKISRRSTKIFILANSLFFLGFSAALGFWCLALAPLVLAALFLYSFTKRWTVFTHAMLGLCLALSPLGAWLAVRGNFEGDLRVPFFLSAAVLLWVWGFDLIYACQDVEFDRKAGLHSIPARYGIPLALGLSAVLHLGVIFFLFSVGQAGLLGKPYWIGLGLVGVLLLVEHWLVRPNDLSRVNLAFFTFNGWVGLGLFGATVLDLHLRSGA